MNNEEYYRVIRNAERLDRSLFDLSNEKKINKLEGILKERSKKQRETMIGVPLVQPYGGPVCEYIVLPERVYRELRAAMVKGEVTRVHPEIGVPYDRERFNINKEQLRNSVDLLKLSRIPPDVIELMKKSVKKAKVYKKPPFSFY